VINNWLSSVPVYICWKPQLALQPWRFSHLESRKKFEYGDPYLLWRSALHDHRTGTQNPSLTKEVNLNGLREHHLEPEVSTEVCAKHMLSLMPLPVGPERLWTCQHPTQGQHFESKQLRTGRQDTYHTCDLVYASSARRLAHVSW
jgi:hypothetical protein